jgi:hypothetical protein
MMLVATNSMIELAMLLLICVSFYVQRFVSEQRFHIEREILASIWRSTIVGTRSNITQKSSSALSLRRRKDCFPDSFDDCKRSCNRSSARLGLTICNKKSICD